MRRIAPLVIAFQMIAATVGNVAFAMDGNRAADATPVNSLDGAYFSGEGFATHPESYATQGRGAANATDKTDKVTALRSGGTPTGHRFSSEEDLYYSGAGFASGANTE